MKKRMLPVLVIALGCGVSKDEFAAQQRDAQQNLAKYQQESEKSTALEKTLADVQQQNAVLQQRLTETTADHAKLEEEKGALEAKSAQYEKLSQTLATEIANGQVELSELKGRMTVKLKD